ncbi:hypothetical protein HDU96_002091, partial [Phlyctochytrium bullatum]
KRYGKEDVNPQVLKDEQQEPQRDENKDDGPIDEIIIQITLKEINQRCGFVYQRQKTAELVTHEITELQSGLPSAKGISTTLHLTRLGKVCEAWDKLYGVYSQLRSLKWRTYRATQSFLEEIADRFAGGCEKDEVYVGYGCIDFGNAKKGQGASFAKKVLDLLIR